MNDLKFAYRQLMKSPVFTLTVVLTIALGIGANTSIFTLVHAILLKSLPVSDPKTLYRIGDKDDCCVNGGFINRNGDFDLFSYDLYKYFEATTPEFDQLTAMQAGGNRISVRRGSEPARSEFSEYVSGNYFSTFGVGALAGRVLAKTDDNPDAPPVAVMSFSTWQSDYGADPSIVGATIFVQSHPVTVVGIAPPGFFGDRIRSSPPALWLPLGTEPLIERENTILHIPASNWLYVVGRVKPGVHLPPLQEKISNNLRHWLSTVNEYTENGGASIIPKQHVILTPAGAGIQNLQQQQGKGLRLLMAISGLVLLVACANVANLLLARSAARRTEMSVRVALGAPRGKLIRQLLTESVLLACLGGAAGVAVAYAGTGAILSLAFPSAQHLPIEASPSLSVLSFAFFLSLLTGVAFGIVPAWLTSRSGPAQELRGANRTTKERVSLQQKALIVFQAALSLILLVGAGLLTRSLSNLEHQNFGIQTTNRFVLHIDPAGAGYTPQKLPSLYNTLEREFGALPGIQHVGLALYSALEGNNWGEGVRVEGRPEPGPNQDTGSSWDRVNPQFFEAVGQPVIRGRGLTDVDTAGSQRVAVVNEAFVKKFFPRENPLGRRFGVYSHKYSSAFTIVGVVADAKYSNPRGEFRPMYFRPLAQQLSGVTEINAATAENRSLYINSITLHFRTKPQNVESAVRRVMARIDPALTVISVRALDDQVALNFTQERLIARLAAIFGSLALLLASVGLYGITAYQVACRTNEIGLRMALGADRARVVTMILRTSLAQVGVGVAIGIPIALAGALSLADQLYHVPSYDILSLTRALIVLGIATTIAGFIPARRAATVDPMNALRNE
ncbi:MAG: ABC transporter permease [Bryobacteraceae bacterium]